MANRTKSEIDSLPLDAQIVYWKELSEIGSEEYRLQEIENKRFRIALDGIANPDDSCPLGPMAVVMKNIAREALEDKS